MAGEEKVTPDMFAYQLCEHIADVEGDEHADEYLIAIVDEVMQLCPAVRERFSDLLLTELVEEITHREDSRHSHSTIELIRQIEND